jgi:hypothetical protein
MSDGSSERWARPREEEEEGRRERKREKKEGFIDTKPAVYGSGV